VVEKMFAWLGVDPRIGALPTFKRQIADRQRLRTRTLVLTEAERQFVNAKRDRGALDRYDARAAAELRASGIGPAQAAPGKHSS
jgi:hypothetical protein